MKLTKYCIPIKLDKQGNEYMIINALNGYIDLINANEYDIMQNFKNQSDIKLSTGEEKEFFLTLRNRQYILDENEENQIKQDLLTALKKQYKAKTESIQNVTFVLSYNCNFSCPYCYEKNVSNSDILTCEMIDKAFLLHNNNIKYITLFGGEPLLLSHKKIIEYIISKSPKSMYTIITNGYTLNDYIEIFKSINIRKVQVTIDGNEEEHNQTRKLKNGSGTYTKIMEGIENCLINHIPITIRMNLSDNNINSIKSERKYLKEKFKLYSQYLSFEVQPQFQLNTGNRLELEKNIMEEDYISYDMISTIKANVLNSTLPSLAKLILYSQKFCPQYNFCYAEGLKRFYDSKGDIYTCILAVGEERKRVGTYYPELKYFKNSMLNRNIETIAQCSDCEKAFICGGGCANIAINQYGDVMHPCCDNIIYELYYKIPFYYNLRKNASK